MKSQGTRKERSAFWKEQVILWKKMYLCRHKKESVMSTTTQIITKMIAEYFKTQPILKAWLFGSFARGEETPDSDVDLLVVYDDKARVSLLKHAAMIEDLETILNRPVDIVEDGTLRPFAVESANRDKKLIYERAN